MRVPHLASAVLGAVARRIGADWQAKYGHGLDALETFVERDRFAGTCYRAANWRCVGPTRGRSRQDRDHTRAVPVKDVYLYRAAPEVAMNALRTLEQAGPGRRPGMDAPPVGDSSLQAESDALPAHLPADAASP